MADTMWTGTVAFKSIETGERVRPDKIMIASSRVALEALYLTDFDFINKKEVYMTVDIESPVGRFFIDLMGWQAIHNERKAWGTK